MKSSRLAAHLNAAQGYAKLSYASRLRVGAVLIRDDRIISVGYNGTPSGYDNTCEEIKLVELPNKYRTVTRPEVCHAELNVIAFAAKNGLATDGSTLVITDSPCFECSKLLVQAGVKEVYYEREYRLTDSLDFLRDNNVKVEKIADETN